MRVYKPLFLLLLIVFQSGISFSQSISNPHKVSSQWQAETYRVYNEILSSEQSLKLSQKDKNIFFDIQSNRIKSDLLKRVDSVFNQGNIYVLFIVEEFSTRDYKHRVEERYFNKGSVVPSVIFNNTLSNRPYLDINGWPHRSLPSIILHTDSLKILDFVLPYKFTGGKVISWDNDKYFPQNYNSFDNYRPFEYRIETLIQKTQFDELILKVFYLIPSDDETKTVIIDISKDK